MEIEALERMLEQMASVNSEIITHLINIEQGLQYLLYIAVAFLVWKVITILYRLFGGVFFGGI
jgi:hypothetical protein